MSSIARPVPKALLSVRTLSSSCQAARPSSLLSSHAQQAKYLPRRLADLKTECSQRQLKTSGSKSELVDRLVAYDLTRSHSTLGVQQHRPGAETSTPLVRARRLMQGFRTSAPQQTIQNSSAIDYVVIPELPEEESGNPYAMRVPLLPDNYTPDRSVGSPHALESGDTAIPKQEITVVAADPDNVKAAALTEVVNNAGIDVDIADLTKSFHTEVKEMKEAGVLKELWSGLVDDILGPKVRHAHN